MKRKWKIKSVSPERLREVFAYVPETGALVWLKKSSATSHSSKVGKRAGHQSNSMGVWIIGLDGESYLAHRLVWIHQSGEDPKTGLVFKNGDAGDCRLENLEQKKFVEGDFDRSTQEGIKIYQRAWRKKFRRHYKDKDLRKNFGISMDD